MEPVSDLPRDNGSHPSLDCPERALVITTESSPSENSPFPVPIGDSGGRTQCGNTGGLYVRGTGGSESVWFPLTCGRWDCPARSCGGLNRAGAAELFSGEIAGDGGIVGAFSRGERVRFYTFTAPSKGMSMGDLYVATKRVMATLRKTGEIREWAGVVELQQRKAPHLHVVATGEFIHYRRLSKLAQGRPGSKGRFGRVVWAEEITPHRGAGLVTIANYFTKDLGSIGGELANYVTKARAEQMREMGSKGQRVRPIRRSNGWYPGGLSAARDAVRRSWYPDAGDPTDGMNEWALYRVEPATGQMRYVKALSVAESSNVALLPSEMARAA